MGRHYDEDGDGLADQADLQARAYRDNPNPTTNAEIASFIAQAHLATTSLSRIHLPEDYEAWLWDAGRDDPPVGV